MGTMHSYSHVQTERAYCVPTAPMGNVQCLQTAEAAHHASTQVTCELRGQKNAYWPMWLDSIDLVWIQGNHDLDVLLPLQLLSNIDN